MNINGVKAEEMAINNVDSLFETLVPLPTPLRLTQCVVHGHEILICGGGEIKTCFSYHTLKNQYKLICSYPEGIEMGHCVVKRLSPSTNELTLLSLSGQDREKQKYGFVMKYKSVWDNEGENQKEKQYNEWMPFTDNSNKLITIGKDDDCHFGLRGVIGGSDNHLLFMTYFPKNIDVFNLNTFQYAKQEMLPMRNGNRVHYHCF
ncbi:hypothetical protein RFI_22661, partial [Reticulomyxa filosa]